MKKILVSVLTLCLIIQLSSCSSVTQINGSWKKPGTTAQKYTKIAVIGISSDVVKRSTIENAIASNLRRAGINAVSGTNILPDNFIDADHNGKVDNKNADALKAKLTEQGVDGIFTVSLEDVKKSTQYVPGTSYYTPYAGFYPFYNYYWSTYENVYSPGYYVQTTNIFMTSNFYNLSSGQLLWSAQSETYDPQSLKDFAQSYAQVVVENFLGDRVVLK